jgi:hypothetical protein
VRSRIDPAVSVFVMTSIRVTPLPGSTPRVERSSMLQRSVVGSSATTLALAAADPLAQGAAVTDERGARLPVAGADATDAAEDEGPSGPRAGDGRAVDEAHAHTHVTTASSGRSQARGVIASG